MFDTLLAYHFVDFLLRSELVCDVIKHENFLFGASLNNKLPLIVVTEVDILRIARLVGFWFESDDHLDLFLFVYPAVADTHR